MNQPPDMPEPLRQLLKSMGIDPDRPGVEVHHIDLHPHATSTKKNPLPPPSMLAGIPPYREADQAGFPMAYLRYFTQDGRGEWYVVGHIEGTNYYAWVRSPTDARYDEFGNMHIDRLDYLREVFDCGPLILDLNFAPSPFDHRLEDPVPDKNERKW